VAVVVSKGEQQTATFKAINLNAKPAALVDCAATVFDSNAILFCLLHVMKAQEGHGFLSELGLRPL
jgi:glutathione S-transferase